MRLIDADAMINSLQKEWDNCEVSNATWIWIREVLRDQPTIDAAPRWVRCEERLPEKNGAYIVFVGYGDNWIWFKDIFMDGKFMADACALNGARVTHWMPIEPPKEG